MINSELDIPKESASLLLKWQFRFRKSEHAHYRSATSCRIFNYALGIPLVIITTIVASELFSLLEKISSNSWPWNEGEIKITGVVVITLSILAPVLAALQTFLRFPERAEQHRKAAINFGLIKKEVEKILCFPPPDLEQLKEVITSIQEKDLQAMKEAPSIGTISLWIIKWKMKPESKERVISKQKENQRPPAELGV